MLHDNPGDDTATKTVGLTDHILRILLCDDNYEFLDRLQEYIISFLRKKGIRAICNSFYSPEQIDSAAMNKCDVAILDIDFHKQNYNGIDIARKLRMVQKNVVIIFLTDYVSYAPEGYEVQAFRYLLKQNAEQKLPQYLMDAIQLSKSEKLAITIQIAGEKKEIRISDLIYFESKQHLIIAHVLENGAEREFSFYDTLSNLESALAGKGFLRIYQSYLVNMRHIIRLGYQNATLSNEAVLRVSERKYAENKAKYLLWMEENDEWNM